MPAPCVVSDPCPLGGDTAQTTEAYAEAPGVSSSYKMLDPLRRAVDAVIGDRFRGLLRLAVLMPGDLSSMGASVGASTATGAPSMC